MQQGIYISNDNKGKPTQTMVDRREAINLARSFIKYPLIETHPYPTSYYKNGDDFLKEIEKGSIGIL